MCVRACVCMGTNQREQSGSGPPVLHRPPAASANPQSNLLHQQPLRFPLRPACPSYPDPCCPPTPNSCCPCPIPNPQVVAPAVAYMRMRCLASPAILMYYVLSGTFRGFKDTK